MTKQRLAILILIVCAFLATLLAWEVWQARHPASPAVTMQDGPRVASRDQQVYHRPDCRWAQKIAAARRVEYPNRAAAVGDGKEACKVCRP